MIEFSLADQGTDTSCITHTETIPSDPDSSFKMRTSLAQVFSGDGDAFVVRGHPFRWEHGKTPHLPHDGAEALMKLIIECYKEFKGDQPPQRVVIHKTSEFYDDEAEWLKACRIDTVATQATGVCWIALYDVLEQHGIRVVLVNARHTKNVPGRKTDVQESQRLMKLHTYGLVRDSFRLPQQMESVRRVWRVRDRHVKEAGRAV